MDELGKLQQFRAERTENNVLHLVFDMPGRPMNVFSNAAIAELGVFSRWLRDSDVRGVVIRSGKPSGFCAGADLAELGLAYDMIMAAPAETRDRVAFDHFFRLSQALRGIETAGKPVAAAIAGLAHAWDLPGWVPPRVDDVAAIIARKREVVLAEALGHYPAPLAILDCVGEGLPQPFDAAIRSEMQIFSKLIQRREPRNMIRTLFLGRLDHDRLRKAGGIPAPVEQAVAAVSEVLQAGADATLANAYARAGFHGQSKAPAFDGVIAQSTFWLEAEPVTDGKRALREGLARVYAVADKWRASFSEDQRRAADYLLVTKYGFPAYMAGAFSSAEPGA